MSECINHETSLTRRTLIRSAAWSAPVIAATVATPLAAASESLTPTVAISSIVHTGYQDRHIMTIINANMPTDVSLRGRLNWIPSPGQTVGPNIFAVNPEGNTMTLWGFTRAMTYTFTVTVEAPGVNPIVGYFDHTFDY